MVAAVKGYRMLVVMPEGLSNERVAISRAYGAEIRFVGHFHVNGALEEACAKIGAEAVIGEFEDPWQRGHHDGRAVADVLSSLLPS